MKCLENFAVECMRPEQRYHFVTLYMGTKHVISDQYAEGSYQTGEWSSAAAVQLRRSSSYQ